MVVKKADPEVAVTTPGHTTQNNSEHTIPDYGAIDKAVQEYLYRYKIDLNHEELVVSTLLKGRWKDSLYHPEFFTQLKKSSENDPKTQPDIYLSTGTLKKSSLTTKGGITTGRTANNLNRTLKMPLDADLIQHIANKEGLSLKDNKIRKELVRELHNMSDEELNHLLKEFITVIKSVLTDSNISYTEIRCSGYGFYALLDIHPNDQTKTKELRTTHGELVELLNKLAGFELFDNAVKDAGTRCIRPENSYNFKNPAMPRLVRVIEKGDES